MRRSAYRLAGVFIVFLLAVASTAASAAEFRLVRDETQPDVPVLYMTGKIQKGDAASLSRLLKSNLKYGPSVTEIWLNSPGGELDEAVRIGELIEKLGYTAIVPLGATCASACFFVWVGASARLAPGDLVIHRPYFHMRDSSQSPSDFENAYRATNEAAALYLRQRNVPAYLIERMLQLSSADGYPLSSEDKVRIGPMSTARSEYMVQNCGFPNATKSGQILARGGLTVSEREVLRKCGMQFYSKQKEAFFSPSD